MTASHAAVIVCVIGAIGCVDSGPGLSAVALTTPERVIIDEWLGCVECSDGELDSVASLSTHKPDAVRDTLRADLFRGPSSTRRDNMRQQLEGAYQEFEALIAPDVPPVTQQQYVDHYLESLISIYRIRAGTALGRTQGAAAVPRLDSAISGFVETPGDLLRQDVLDALSAVRDSAANL